MDEFERLKQPKYSMIQIADGQNNRLLSHIHFDYLLFNDHERNRQNNQELFTFTTFADKPFSEHLSKRNRIIIPGEDGELREFIIFEAQVDRLNKQTEVFCSASFLDLKKSKVIAPHRTTAESAERHTELALSGTEWKVGNIAYKGVRTLTFENYLNPLTYLKRVASEFDLELDFRVEHDGSSVTGRYVDLVEQVGTWRGRIVEFGRDLLELRRIEKTDNVVTALLGIGPEQEDGTRLEVFVEDRDALSRWGRNSQHLVEEYEPASNDINMTIERLEQLTRAELNKRINASVSFVGGIADLENVEGMENKKIRFGDTIRIKDTSYDPPLYLEAKVFKQNRDIKVQGQKKIELGDYVDFTEAEISPTEAALMRDMERLKQDNEMNAMATMELTKMIMGGS